ncbi:LON peptidase substrate-binding domain-containing protein [Shewanella sp. A3A]|nr:LON peptidase substrate-binding domain-containing protein [Shewanella ferrihydritica]
MLTIPLFPLPICLMPEGLAELRIFEPRYQRLVVEASQNGIGFGVSPYDSNSQQLFDVGCIARIVDFKHRDDGLLGILIKGQQRFRLSSFTVEHDGLKRGNVELLPSWPEHAIHTRTEHQLAELLTPLLPEAYQNNNSCQSMTWVCQRWLEILPINLQAKQQLMCQNDAHMTQELLKQLL